MSNVNMGVLTCDFIQKARLNKFCRNRKTKKKEFYFPDKKFKLKSNTKNLPRLAHIHEKTRS